jgi:anti-anti-sigma factor
MSTLEIEIIEQDGVNVAVIVGSADSASCDEFKASLARLTKMQVPKIVLDCKDLTYMNSSAFGILLKFYRDANVHMRKVVICNQNKRIEKGMALLGLQHHIRVFPSREEAIKALTTNP